MTQQGTAATWAQRSTRRPKAPRPPTVRWRNKRDKARAKQPDVMNRFAQNAVNEVWHRLPLCVRLLLARFMEKVYIAHVSRPEEDDPDDGFCLRLTDIEGRVFGDDMFLILNLAYFESTKKDRPRMLWVIAHELAHVYLAHMRRLAYLGFRSQQEKRLKAGQTFKQGFTDVDDDDLADAIIGHPKQEESSLNERLADNIAITWGFDVEVVLYDLIGLEVEKAEKKSATKPRGPGAHHSGPSPGFRAFSAPEMKRPKAGGRPR